jgi:hypothetical protein
VQIHGTRSNDPVVVPAGTKHYGRTDDVGCPSDATELTRLPRPLIVERLDIDIGRPEETSKTRLAPAVPPHLSDDARRNYERKTVLEGPRKQRDHETVIPFERDESPSVQGQS